MASKTGASGRTRNFATVVYPESAPDDWLSLLAEQCVPAFVSPLHDQDLNPDGESKKPHYHVMLMFENVKTKEQAQEILNDLIGGVGLEVVQSLRGYARYLCHLDNPDKHQYDPEQVTSVSGADYMAAIGLPTDKYKAIGEMLDFCEANNIYSFAELLLWSRSNHFDWFRVLCDSGAVVVEKYLKSRYWDSKHGPRKAKEYVDNV